MKPAGSAWRKKERSAWFSSSPSRPYIAACIRVRTLLSHEAVLARGLERLTNLFCVPGRCCARSQPDPAREGHDHLVHGGDRREARRQRRPGALGLGLVGEGTQLNDAARATGRLGRRLGLRRDRLLCLIWQNALGFLFG